MIYKNKDINLISSCYDGNIRIFDFHSGILLNKIRVNNQVIFEICLCKNDFLFIGCGDNKIRIINLKNGLIIKDLFKHNNAVVNIKKIIHPFYGEYIISQGKNYDKIILWVLDSI